MAAIAAVLAIYTTTSPRVTAPSLDDEPLRPPFTIENDHWWYTLRNVRPNCVIVSQRTDSNSTLKGPLGTSDARSIGDIGPRQRRSVTCPRSLFASRTLALEIAFQITYAIQWLPGWTKEYAEQRRFRFDHTATDAAHWSDEPLSMATPCIEQPGISIQYNPVTPTP